MVIRTLIESQKKLVPAEVEIMLLPGIPQIHFLGLPDKVIKESFFRIKSALKSSGYKFPVSQQVIVNIRPNSLKKSSQGLELAVALGILHLTDQKKMPDSLADFIVYGELDLDGGVRIPSDLIHFEKISKYKILTGKNENPDYVFSSLENLKSDIHFQLNQTIVQKFVRPEIGLNNFYSADEAELLFLMSVGGLHTLLAGQAGSGKSFLAKQLISFLSYSNRMLAQHKSWFPVIAPHHSLTPGAFLGGGVSLQSGEIEKVTEGVLILDELLEFHREILESLREPMTGESLRIARAGQVKIIKPDFQVIATTNLCPCGKWTPAVQNLCCRFSIQKCKGYMNTLSGPLLDRFGLLFFHHNQKVKRFISGFEILERIEKYNLLNPVEVQVSDCYEIVSELYPDISARRIQSLIKVAQIYARESQKQKVDLQEIHKSEKWTIQNFERLSMGMT